jgi:hypothetical protein
MNGSHLFETGDSLHLHIFKGIRPIQASVSLLQACTPDYNCPPPHPTPVLRKSFVRPFHSPVSLSVFQHDTIQQNLINLRGYFPVGVKVLALEQTLYKLNLFTINPRPLSDSGCEANQQLNSWAQCGQTRYIDGPRTDGIAQYLRKQERPISGENSLGRF